MNATDVPLQKLAEQEERRPPLPGSPVEEVARVERSGMSPVIHAAYVRALLMESRLSRSAKDRAMRRGATS